MTETVAYRRPSRLTDGRLELQTSGGFAGGNPARHPLLYAGMTTAPAEVAAGLAVVGTVAAADFRHGGGAPAASPADPVISSGDGWLRAEALSACSGVHARLDLLPSALDGETYAIGTTSIDLHPTICAALARFGAGPLHLSVGPDALSLDQPGNPPTVERTLRLPERWLSALAGAAPAAAALHPQASLDAASGAALLHRLPHHGGRDVRWLVPSGRSLRMAGAAVTGAICLAGAVRLAVLAPVLPLLRSVRLYGPPTAPGSPALLTGWELDLGPVRLSLLFSPGLDRPVAAPGHP